MHYVSELSVSKKEWKVQTDAECFCVSWSISYPKKANFHQEPRSQLIKIAHICFRDLEERTVFLGALDYPDSRVSGGIPEKGVSTEMP